MVSLFYRNSKTQIDEGDALRCLHLFGFYVLSKTYIAIAKKAIAYQLKNQ